MSDAPNRAGTELVELTCSFGKYLRVVLGCISFLPTRLYCLESPDLCLLRDLVLLSGSIFFSGAKRDSVLLSGSVLFSGAKRDSVFLSGLIFFSGAKCDLVLLSGSILFSILR